VPLDIDPMPVTMMFDLAAPIAITHFADLCYEDKARECCVELWSNALVRLNVRQTFQKRPYAILSREEWMAYIDAPENDDLEHINTVYKDLFMQIVTAMHPQWKVACDSSGAIGFRDEDGRPVFFGDGNNELPWYETAELLVKRIQEYERQVEKEFRE
jgi:hypothetical protein